MLFSLELINRANFQLAVLVWDNLCIFKLITRSYHSWMDFLRFRSSPISCSVKYGMAWRMPKYYFWRFRKLSMTEISASVSIPFSYRRRKNILNKRLLGFKIILHIKSKNASPFNKQDFVSFNETTSTMNS